MYRGRIVESGPTKQVWAGPRHPYTHALLAAVPLPDGLGRLPDAPPDDVEYPLEPALHWRTPSSATVTCMDDPLGAEWATHRPAVFGVAYRLLGSVADAEDVTQDVWLRAAGADLSEVADLRAWLVTVSARRSYDILKSARVRRESYVGPWLPEPLLTGPDAAEPVLVDESVSAAMLLIMEELSPPERVAFVLHDVFGLEFARIAEVLATSAPAARQLASRARRRVAQARETVPPAPKAERDRVLTVFRAAYLAGDLATLVQLLHPDAVYVTDGGDKAAAARKPILGGERIGEVMVRVGRQWRPDRIDAIEVGGELALLFQREGRVYSVDTVQITDGSITAYRRVINPDKLAHVRVVTPAGTDSSP